MTNNAQCRGVIFDIERNSFVDGPGIRTTVFFKGCNLRCAWCHNPESQSSCKEIMFYESKCTKCGRCSGLTVNNEDFICFNDAREICGRLYTSDEVLDIVLKDKTFFDTSEGGVTFSGGECMLQPDFLRELLIKCKEYEIHTAIDTAGFVPWEEFEKVLPYTDLFLYDIKAIDKTVHKKYTGVDNTLILENLAALLRSDTPVWVRVPLIPSVNCTDEEMNGIKAFFEANRYPDNFELLPYHAMGEHKYAALGKTAQTFSAPEKETVERLKKIVTSGID